MSGIIQEVLKTIGDKLEARLGMSENANIYLELRSNKKQNGVPFDAWTTRNQKRLAHGQKPVGHPEHPNV
ncbi:MAG: hypothetical protein WC784_03955 [Candidatus Shapirobacteria bacterium]|jgi:hypothetical protein